MSGQSAYPYYSGVQVGQELAGRNKRASYYTNPAQEVWYQNPQARAQALSTMETSASRSLGIPQTNVTAHTRRSGTYVNAKYTSATGEPRVAHYSAHPVGGPGSLIGPFHAKAETYGKPVYQARNSPQFYPEHQGIPSFGERFVEVKGEVPGPRVTSHTPAVFGALGQAYTSGLQQFHQPRPRGGKTSKFKRTRKHKKRSHKDYKRTKRR
jgi:hypothetical protein